MSTYPQYTLKSHDVYKLTINTLDTLPLTMPGVIQSRDLLRVLVFAAASRLSVHQACDQLERAPSGPTVLGTLASQFSDLEALEGHLNALLATLIPKGVGKRGCRVAVDVVALPYHGTVDDAHHDEVCRSKAKCGTTHFFTYATAYAVVRGRRRQRKRQHRCHDGDRPVGGAVDPVAPTGHPADFGPVIVREHVDELGRGAWVDGGFDPRTCVRARRHRRGRAHAVSLPGCGAVRRARDALPAAKLDRCFRRA